MEPTLHCAAPANGCKARFSDRVIANRVVYRFSDPKRGDIIVFQAPAATEKTCQAGGAFIKRIVGLPGEILSMRHGAVYVNGVRLREAYLHPRYQGDESGAWARVPSNAYFVLGDNRSMSCDSRRWGTVPRGNIIGRAELTYWPPPRAGTP